MNIEREARVSLLFDGTAGLDEPLTGARVSLQGRAERLQDPQRLARYVARHPSAEAYAGFADFGLFRVVPEHGHLVAGFGRIHWVDDLLVPAAPELATTERDIVAHMNDDHAEALDLFAARFCGKEGAKWRLTGVDPEGADLRRGGEVARLDFATRVEDATAARNEFSRLVKEARTER